MFSDYMKNHSYNHISSYLPEIADRKLPDSYKTTTIPEIGVHIYMQTEDGRPWTTKKIKLRPSVSRPDR